MNRQDDYISIKDFAERAGVTRQTVYNKLDTILQKYVKVVKGKKSINTSALKLFDVKGFDNNVKNDLTDLTTDFTDIFSVLQDQLQVKDKQLKDQAEQSNKQLEIKDFQIAELNKANNRLNDRLQESNQLNHQNQILLDQKQQPQPIEAPTGPVKKSFWDRFKRKEK